MVAIAMGWLLMLACAAASMFAGFKHWPLYSVLALGIAWAIGYAEAGPILREEAEENRWLYAASWSAVYAIASTIFYSLGFVLTL